MRVSTQLLYNLGVNAISRQQTDLLQTQQQIATGRRMLTPADDPVAAAQALAVAQSKAQTSQYAANIGTAKDALALNESVLAQVTEALQELRTLAVNGGSGALNDSDRASIATDVASHLQQLLGLANSRDGNGGALFGGFQLNGQPFVDTGSTIAYTGDQGVRQVQAADGRTIAISVPGSGVFDAIATGNGTFAATAGPANTGTGLIDAGQVQDPSLLTGHAYRLTFNVAGSTTTYDVVDTTTGTTVSTGNSFTSGSAISIAGMAVTITGAPASGDQFSLAPARQSVFKTVQNLIDVLRTPATTPAGRSRVANGISVALQNLDQAQETVLTVRARVGGSLSELDTLAASNQDRTLQYDSTLSHLQDLDYNKALSDFSRQQLALEAAQKSFLKVTGLSLFSYL